MVSWVEGHHNPTLSSHGAAEGRFLLHHEAISGHAMAVRPSPRVAWGAVPIALLLLGVLEIVGVIAFAWTASDLHGPRPRSTHTAPTTPSWFGLNTTDAKEVHAPQASNP